MQVQHDSTMRSGKPDRAQAPVSVGEPGLQLHVTES